MLSVRIAATIILATSSVAAATPPMESTRDHLATKAYYQKLIAEPSRGAELELFTTLLPKGGDLHHHYTGSIYAETYLDWMARQGKCLHVTSWRIGAIGAPDGPDDGGHCATAAEIAANDTLYRALLMRWSDKDFSNHTHEEPPPDKQFFDTFGWFGAVSGYAPREGLQQLKARALGENVQYIETMLRGVWPGGVPANAADLDKLTSQTSDAEIDKALAQAFASLEANVAEQDAVSKYKSDLETDARGLDGDGFTMRFQTYVSRNASPSQTFTGLYSAFKAAQGEPLIVGVNIVGPENGVVAMRDYRLHMRMFRFLKARFPSTHLAMHAGELTVGMVPPEGLRFHIREAVEEAGAERIGHGVDIADEDGAIQLLKEMKQRQVAVEINLTSNKFILGVEGDAHPVTLYRRVGVPIVISTDDSGVSRSTLSHEYLLFARTYKPSYNELKRTVYDSIRYSFLPPADKQKQLQELDRRYETFEKRVAASLAPLGMTPASAMLSSHARARETRPPQLPHTSA